VVNRRRVFPIYMGIFRKLDFARLLDDRIPHIHGDIPCLFGTILRLWLYSPYTWGYSGQGDLL